MTKTLEKDHNEVIRFYYKHKDKILHELTELFLDNVDAKPTIVKFGIKLPTWFEHYTGFTVSFGYTIPLSKVKQLPTLCIDKALESYFRKYTNVKCITALECNETYESPHGLISGHLKYIAVVQC